METEINTLKRFNSMKNTNVKDVPQFSAHRWEVLHSRRCCCTSQWPAPSGRCQHWATPGLRDAGWSGRRARRPRTGPPGWATTSPSGSWCCFWMRGRDTLGPRDALQMRLCGWIRIGLTFHRSCSSHPNKAQAPRTIHSLLVRCWCWPHRSCCVPGGLRDKRKLIILHHTYHTGCRSNSKNRLERLLILGKIHSWQQQRPTSTIIFTAKGQKIGDYKGP